MGTRLVPGSSQSEDIRVLEYVPYHLWYVPYFPLGTLGGKLDKDPESAPRLQGLYDDIKQAGYLRNPVFVWNHHRNRLTGKQPEWLLRAGSNRVWCCEQLGWDTVPALVSTVGEELPPAGAKWGSPDMVRITPRTLADYLKDPGVIWANEHGFGLLKAARPEETYADAENRHLAPTTHHGRSKIITTRETILNASTGQPYGPHGKTPIPTA